MKHVRESLNQYYDYKFFKVFEEDEKADLQTKEKDGLAVIEKLKKNFEDFKKGAKDEILKYKEFWEENKKTKEGFTESGEVYKLFDSDYVVGVLELPVETLSDGSIDGGFGATDEPEEEIIEGPEIGSEETIEETPEGTEETKEDFYEEQQVPNKVTEAEETGDDLKDLGAENPAEEAPVEEEPVEEPDNAVEIPELPDAPGEETGDDLGMDEPTDEMPAEEPMTSEPAPDLTAPQTYFVVYDISGDEREEIFRCGSNNVVNAFKSFYNDTFKGSMKNAILKYKQAKELEKKEAEKAEKQKVETSKDSKLKKFLGESQLAYLNAVHSVSKLDEKYKEQTDPVKDMGIGQTLEQEMDEKEISPEMQEFDGEDENTISWSGILIHPMSGYRGNFEYLNLTVTLTKEGSKKYVVTQTGERRNGKLSRYEQRQLDDGDLEIDEWNITDFDSDLDYEIDDREEFKTLEDAIEYIDSEQCLDFQG